jgi:tetratricopeptide (TPR) repeat protein
VAVLALLLTAAVADDDDDTMQELDEIIKLADEAIAAGNAEGYLIKAGALARKGQWTEGLKVYNEGLKRLIKPEYAEGLGKLIDNHPSFNLPDPLRIPDPTRADKHYSAGLRMYFAGRYAEAEKELKEAYRNQGDDARILYYLGLAEMAQPGKRKISGEHFLMAYNLEQQSKPGPQAVNASLERVQGEVRQYLNKFRGQ